MHCPAVKCVGGRVKTYSLTEVAQALCGDSMKLPELWLKRQIVAGRFAARRVGRTWRMTQDDIDHALAVMSNSAVPTPAPVADPLVAPVAPLSRASQRRRLVVAQ